MGDKLTIDRAREKGTIIFECYRGSFAYGTFIEGKSDMDKAGVYVLPLEDLLGGNYYEQINDAKSDEVYYELGRFLDLLAKNNPTMIELLNVSEDCIIYKHPIMDEILKHKDIFITKVCRNSFGGYVKQQLDKASGLNKKMNKSIEELTIRKNVLDFIYTPFEQGSQHIATWLENRGLKQQYCGLVSVPNMRYTYALYYDYAHHIYSENLNYRDAIRLFIPAYSNYYDIMNTDVHLRYKGIVHDLEKSNDISLSSIQKEDEPLCTVQFNKDGYSQHCNKFKEDQTWLKERNTARYVDVQNANEGKTGQMIDSKNMLHCVRLLRMCREIVEGKGIIVKRPDFQYLLDIRHGKYDLEHLQKECEITLKEIDSLWVDSNLPEDVDRKFVQTLLCDLRKQFYGI